MELFDLIAFLFNRSLSAKERTIKKPAINNRKRAEVLPKEMKKTLLYPFKHLALYQTKL